MALIESIWQFIPFLPDLFSNMVVIGSNKTKRCILRTTARRPSQDQSIDIFSGMDQRFMYMSGRWHETNPVGG